MGYKQTPPTVYIVQWPQIGVFKVGCSERQRWRMFALRGAELIARVPFTSSTEAYDFESFCHIALESNCVQAFSSRMDAEPYVGSGGGGWLECYQTPELVQPFELPAFVRASVEQCSRIGKADARACAPALLQLCPGNAHTDRQTYKHISHLGESLTLGNARTRVPSNPPNQVNR